MRMKTIIAALAVAFLALPLAAQASPPATRPIPLPLAAQAAVNKAHQARAKALAAYRLAVRSADRAEFLALKVAERQTMRTGTLQQAEAVHAEISRVQQGFASLNPIPPTLAPFRAFWGRAGWPASKMVDITAYLRRFYRAGTLTMPKFVWIPPVGGKGTMVIMFRFPECQVRVNADTSAGLAVTPTSSRDP